MTGLAILAILATGALSFWPSSVLRPYAGFFVSNFFLALGISCLEVAANLFIPLAGPGELFEARLNLGRGSTESVQRYLPSSHRWPSSPASTNWPCSACSGATSTVALFVVSLAIVFY
ncbi:hypothetical protein JCM24511_02055 [Saitozyma sp. JCM 24511]|nr:hypothetical protein JCM24511_02055 [Saitozyma sp. JCM 24511]